MRRSLGIGLALVCAALVASASTVWAGTLLVDDFDRGEKPNALGGDFGAWNKDEADPTQQCVNSFDKENAYGGVGYALKLDYDVDSPNSAYNGFWMNLQGTDVSEYKSIVVYVKGDELNGHTEQVKLELKNKHKNEVGRYLLEGINGEWQRFSIPLSEFSGLTDLTELTEFVVVFDDLTSTQKVGAIYLDEIAFENER